MSQIAFTQGAFKLEGTIIDHQTNDPLQGATVIDVNTGYGTSSDSIGNFQLTIDKRYAHILVSYLGFADVDTLLDLQKSRELILRLIPKTINYKELQITASKEMDFINSIRMGDVSFTKEELNSLPKFLGEADPIRYLQLTPGVQSSSEGGIGFFVRGGGVDQNLVLYDNALIYNPGHLLGFVSVFNPDIISEVSLIKTGIPARFGGRLSSVLQVRPDRGRSDSLRVKGQLGIVASRITVNRSFNKDRGSFVLSARSASIDMFVKPLIFPLLEDVNPFLNQSSYTFYDFNGGISYRIGRKDIISVSAFYGEDKFGIERNERIAETNMNWGNLILSGRWSHVFSDKVVLGTTVSKTDYHFDLSGSQSEFIFSLFSAVNDYSIKSKLDIYSERHKLSFGYELGRHVFTPNKIDARTGNFILNFFSYNKQFAYEGGVFAEDEFYINEKLGVSLGLRYSFFNQVGPFTEYIYDQSSLLSDSILYPQGQSLAFYHHPEPRISIVYKINEDASIKASYMHLAQYLHLATSSAVSLPTDIWLPSSKIIKPQYGDQLSVGYFVQWPIQNLESSVEIYYKHARNQLEFVRGVISSSLNQNLYDNLLKGIGRSYGAEFFLRKKNGKLTGWSSYAISRSEREFEMINDGRVYPAKNDRRHDFSVAGVYELNKYWNLSAVFIYVSGNAFTLPTGRYIIQGNLINEYGKVNNYRMPAYSRLDLSASRSRTTPKGNVSSWDFSIYNAYNRSNPFYIYFETTGDPDTYQLEIEPVLVSLFPIIPSVSWRFEF